MSGNRRGTYIGLDRGTYTDEYGNQIIPNDRGYDFAGARQSMQESSSFLDMGASADSSYLAVDPSGQQRGGVQSMLSANLGGTLSEEESSAESEEGEDEFGRQFTTNPALLGENRRSTLGFSMRKAPSLKAYARKDPSDPSSARTTPRSSIQRLRKRIAFEKPSETSSVKDEYMDLSLDDEYLVPAPNEETLRPRKRGLHGLLLPGAQALPGGRSTRGTYMGNLEDSQYEFSAAENDYLEIEPSTYETSSKKRQINPAIPALVEIIQGLLQRQNIAPIPPVLITRLSDEDRKSQLAQIHQSRQIILEELKTLIL